MCFRSISLRGLQTSGKHLSSLIVMEMGKFQEKNLEWYVFFGPVFNISFSSLLMHGFKQGDVFSNELKDRVLSSA